MDHGNTLGFATDAATPVHKEEPGEAVSGGGLVSEEQFRALVDEAPIGVAVADPQGTLVYVNRYLATTFGYESEELVGQGIARLTPELGQEGYSEFRDASTRPPSTRREVTAVRKDRSEFPVEIGVNPIAGRRNPAVLVWLRDVSEREHKKEQPSLSREDLAVPKDRSVSELREANKELQEANKELEDFAYAASHDLKEPLRNLVSYAQLLREDLPDNLPEEAGQDLRFIVESASRMQRLVQDLLAFSRAGRGALRKETLPLEDCVRESLDALAKSVDENEVSLEQDALPTVSGDRRLLTQLYQNLLANAVKFHRPGVAPHIQITAEEQGREWLLGVRDNGIGIAPEHAARIFSPFNRLHGVADFEGTGVGLAICRKAVERHGGRIWVESDLGHGSYFRFTLPMAGS